MRHGTLPRPRPRATRRRPPVWTPFFLYLTGAIRQLGLLLLPFLPTSAEEILKVVGEESHRLAEPSAWLDGLPGRAIERPEPIFPRLDVVA